MRDKDKAKEYYKKYYAENKEKLKEKGRRYFSENKEKIKKYAKEYQQKNRENLCKKSREYQADNKEKLLTNNILNKEENKEELAKKKQVFLANYNQMVRKKLEKKCIKCEKEKPFNRFLVRELRSGNLAIRNVCKDCCNPKNYYSKLTEDQKKIHQQRAKQWAVDNRARSLFLKKRSRVKNKVSIAAYCKKNRLELRDPYIIESLKRGCNLKAKDIPKSLILVERIQIQIKNHLKEIRK